MTTVDISQVEFETQIAEFETEFRMLFAKVLIGEDTYNARLNARNALLPCYPDLQHCYDQHGLHVDEPIQEQPLCAQRGRRIAGVMYGVANEYQEKFDKEKEEMNNTQEMPLTYVDAPDIDEPRYIRRGEITKTPVFDKAPQGMPYYMRVAKGIKNLQPGEQCPLYYDNYLDAKRDQALVTHAVEYLGWNKGNSSNSRIYKTTLDKEPDDHGEYALTVYRLTAPIPAKRYERR